MAVQIIHFGFGNAADLVQIELKLKLNVENQLIENHLYNFLKGLPYNAKSFLRGEK